MTSKIRLLIADDSPTLRRAVKALVQPSGIIEVVGEAADGADVVQKAATLRPDVITMDVMMPLQDGLRATEEIMATTPTRIVVVSALARVQQDLAVRALAAGALEILPKPNVETPADLERWGQQLVESIQLMREIPVVTRRRSGSPIQVSSAWMGAGQIAAMGIVSSTGGPEVLATILGGLPANLPIPILIAQHVAVGFMESLARWMSQVSPLKVQISRHGQAARAGHVYLPEPGCNLELHADGTLLSRPCADKHCPSGDVLLASLARALGARAGGAVLSGMGDDGAKGLLAIRQSGGLTAVQEPSTCVVDSMPRSALEARATERRLSPESLVCLITEAAQGSRAPP